MVRYAEVVKRAERSVIANPLAGDLFTASVRLDRIDFEYVFQGDIDGDRDNAVALGRLRCLAPHRFRATLPDGTHVANGVPRGDALLAITTGARVPA